MSRRISLMGSLARAVGIISAVIIVVTGVSYAALQGPQASLLNNSIESATADLRIGTSAASFAASRTGFAFKDLVPGGVAAPAVGNSVFLKNYGSANLNVRMSIGSIPVNASAVDLNKVSLVLTRVDTGTSQTFSVKALVDAYNSGGLSLTDPLAGGAIAEYKLQAMMTADAFTGQSALIDDIDIIFNGIGVN